ncbi:patatin-like phospholipase family protein [Niveibacterium umoris]|uniref:NTE family protein n=1 Tax=Niveibacterium umoris TaxID=1193620 RepID=A0A840BUL2_9RHOO|nr:patatin-like phospholipase family protein [Niveibacterium umoris]MBB4014486.1 NTE family protein [Niveibacterium umoris]
MKCLFAGLLAILALSHAFPASAAPAAASNAATTAARPKIGLVLGGGGARGLAHVGVIEQLERMRVPIDCIAGTSAGALVGGIYASGMPVPEIVRNLEQADWDRLIGGTPDRRNLPYTRKRDDYQNLAAATFGLDAEGLKVPRSVVGSQFIDRFLREMTRDIYKESFNDLPIPFEAVATDLEKGDMRVFKSGDLAIALRASMAVPGVFDVVDDNGRLLVDGMFVRNLPVENLKDRSPGSCAADIVIVVDVGTPMLKTEQIRTFLDVASQAMNIATGRNVIEQRKLIGPSDVLIEPNLDGYTPASFTSVKEIIQRGREAMKPFEARLAGLAMDDTHYRGWLTRIAGRTVEAQKPYDKLVVTPTRFVPLDTVESVIAGDVPPATQAQLLDRFDKVYDSGDFDSINYRLQTEGGQRIATVTPLERSVGPNYLRMGIDFKLDTYRTASISFLGNYQLTWLNQWGAQWRNDLRLGAETSLQSEFYQPLADTQTFLVGRVAASTSSLPLFDESGNRLFEIGVDARGAELGGGYSFGRFGEIRVTGFTEHLKGEVVTGGFGLTSQVTTRLKGGHALLIVDQLDNPKWPRHGYFLRSDYVAGKLTDVDDQANLLQFDGDLVGTLGTYTVRGTARVRGSLDQKLSTVPVPYQLGGFLQLSGLQTNQLTGARTGLGRVMVYKQISALLPQLGSGTYIGGSLEGGKVWNQIFTGTNTKVIPAASAYLGVDTVLGPLYLGLGWSEYDGSSKWAGYLYLGYTN